MKNIYFFFISIFIAESVFSTLRIDLKDRTKEEVLEKAYKLGNQHPYAPVTCFLAAQGFGTGSGVALDPYTILTAAHLIKFFKDHELNVTTIPDMGVSDSDQSLIVTATAAMILHPSFKLIESDKSRKLTYVASGNYEFQGITLDQWAQKDFSDFCAHIPSDTYAFLGTDLAIVKLDEPLPAHLVYPKILNADSPIKGQYVTMLGYGPEKYNDQAKGPQLVGDDMGELFKKKLLSLKVSAHDQSNLFSKLLVSRFEAWIVNGDESFIPNETMMKTEGLPNGGDSGGPLFLKVGEQYELAGIISQNLALSSECFPEESEAREALAGVRQSVFSTSVDIRHYKGWIDSHMGPVKK